MKYILSSYGWYFQLNVKRNKNTPNVLVGGSGAEEGERWERRSKNEFAFFQSLSKLFLPTYFIKCRRTLLELNSKGPYPSAERETKFRRCLFMSSIKREIRHVYVVVVQKRAKKCTKQAWCTCKVVVLVIKPIFFFWRSRCRPRLWIFKSLLRTKCVPQWFLGSLLGTCRYAIAQFFCLSLVTVPDVFARLPSRF